MKRILLAIFVILVLSAMGCASSSDPMKNKRVDEFLNALDRIPKTEVVSDPDQKFLALFGDFKTGTTDEIIEQLYAKEFYFNDTFKTIRARAELTEYLQETANTVELTKVEILDVSKSDSDYYLRWVMHMKFTAKGREVDSRSIGMTQIRFDQEGKVILHQDYWDGAEGFYQHLPIVGYIVNKIKSKL